MIDIMELINKRVIKSAFVLRKTPDFTPGFHVTTTSYKIFVEKNHIQPHINKLLDGIDSNNTSQLENVSTQIEHVFSSTVQELGFLLFHLSCGLS